MRTIIFSINENYYNEFKEICIEQDITIKRKINYLIAQDTAFTDIRSYYPDDYDHHLKKLSLKVNEEFYRSFMKNCDRNNYKIKQYIPYLIFRFLKDYNNK